MSTKHIKTDDPSEVHLPFLWTPPPGRHFKALVVPQHTAENSVVVCTKDSFSMNGVIFFATSFVPAPLLQMFPFRELSGEVRMSSRMLIATYALQHSPQSPRATAACSQRWVFRELFGELVSNMLTSPCTHSCNYFLFPVRLDLLCGNPVTVPAKLSRAWSNSSYFWWSSIDVCIHICKYVCIHVCTNAHMFVCVYICMYIGAGHLCVCMYVCMYLQSEKTHM